MKNFKRILLAVVAVFAAVLLVACGAKSDNGTYVYKPSKTEVKEILEEQGAPSSSVDALIDNVKLEVSVTIKDKTGSLKIKGEMMGQKTDQSFDMKVDQQKKTLQSETGEGEKGKYNPIPFAKIMRQKGTKTPPLPCSVALRGISVFITIGN